MASGQSEWVKRAGMAFASASAYAVVFATVLWIDRGQGMALSPETLRFVVHSHLFLLCAALLWVFGYERFNPLVAAALLIDIIVLSWDRVSTAAAIVACLAIASCVYATVRNVSNQKDQEESHHGI